MSGVQGIGSFVAWEGGCMFIGRAPLATPVHAHYAIQLGFGSTAGIRFRTGDREPWTAYGGAVIASRQPHAMDATVVPFNAVIFIEPETREGRAIAEAYLRGGIEPLPEGRFADPVAHLFATWHEHRAGDRVAAAAHAVVQALTNGVHPTVASDERILRAVRYIRSHLESPLTLEEVAAEACLSPSRFRHLFVEETGMALRPYILWRRFLRVWELITEGASVSAAAHGAGFADASHLTRTCRRMFGFPPSAMLVAPPTGDARDADVRGAGVRAADAHLGIAPTRAPVAR